jgi:inosine-uridine nucleoside N-ribohydrolase
VGITVSAGNGGLENTEKNALRILKFFGLDKKVPVLVGSNVKYNGE